MPNDDPTQLADWRAFSATFFNVERGHGWTRFHSPDGLKHHVGPFKRRFLAEQWIAKHSSDWETERLRVHDVSEAKPIKLE